ncbi:hypothetical protein K7711_31910 [Nocardia sp. CA2R105]|uniref:toprim domain-containing protein n=1 Tax=Nocardia coffeae TaxID=2873381 RepID=UPI001CA5F47F|nr:toprim domain-containing protein [Nocardia coffeae]MBY8861120.1 hypothetical protein [Nocardia coffeae]
MSGHEHGASFDRVVDALRQVTIEGSGRSGQWTKFVCPAHADSHPSLGVKYDPSREKTIVVCFAGCPQEDILDAAKLRVRDLFDHLPDRNAPGYRPPQRGSAPSAPRRRQAPRPQPGRGDELGEVTGARRRVATYYYTTASNDPVGQVIRTQTPHQHGVEKGFYQRRWDTEQKQYVPGGFSPVVYQAPTVAWAIKHAQPILLCEGEKDVNRAIAEGYPATCNAAGAGKFTAEHAEQLRGAAHVVIVADRDRAGFDHALQVHDRLQGVAGQITVMQAATGKDLSDHLDAGHGLNDLTWIPPDQLQMYREGPTTASASGSGPERPSAVSVINRAMRQPEMDWGLDR